MNIADYRDIHKDQTMLLVGNAGNLALTPPWAFDYPSIGTNTIVLYDGWSPDYYIAVDRRIDREFGKAIKRKYADIPKFIPDRMTRDWNGDTFIRWPNVAGPLWQPQKGTLWQPNIDTKPITYANVMHVAIKLAWHMGANPILIIGMEHDPNNLKRHFWAEVDSGMGSIPLGTWLDGYKQLADGLHNNGVEIYNISVNTFVPENIIPRADWHKYANAESTAEIRSQI